MLVDARGHPLALTLTSGAAGDKPQALPPLAGVATQEVLADRGDAADATSASRAGALQAVATIPPQQHRIAPRDGDDAAYKERHLVACFLGKLQ